MDIVTAIGLEMRYSNKGKVISVAISFRKSDIKYLKLWLCVSSLKVASKARGSVELTSNLIQARSSS